MLLPLLLLLCEVRGILCRLCASFSHCWGQDLHLKEQSGLLYVFAKLSTERPIPAGAWMHFFSMDGNNK